MYKRPNQIGDENMRTQHLLEKGGNSAECTSNTDSRITSTRYLVDNLRSNPLSLSSLNILACKGVSIRRIALIQLVQQTFTAQHFGPKIDRQCQMCCCRVGRLGSENSKFGRKCFINDNAKISSLSIDRCGEFFWAVTKKALRYQNAVRKAARAIVDEAYSIRKKN